MHGVADPAPQDRSESDEVPAKLRKCRGKRSKEWKKMEDIGGTRELGGSASVFDGFEEIMELYLQRARCEAHARDPDCHLTLDTVVCLGLHVDEEANQYVSAVLTPSLCLNPVRALQHGMVRELYGDATHKMSHHLINRRQMSVDDISGGSHLWGIMFQQRGTESGDHYKQICIMLRTIMEDVRLCDDCQFCNTIRGVSV